MDTRSELPQQLLPYIYELKSQVIANPYYLKAGLLFSELQKVPHLAIALAVVLLSTICLWGWLSGRRGKLDFPIVGDPSASDFRPALEEGTKKYPNSPFILPTGMHPTVILPHSAIDEIKTLPEEVVSLRQHHYIIFIGGYTHFGNKADELDAAIRIDLTRNVERMLECFQDEVHYAFEQNMGSCLEWTPIPVYEKMLRVVSLLSSRVFVGLPLSRTEEWVQTTCQYAIDGAAGAHALTPYPWFLRPLVAPFLLGSLKKHRALARKMMQPLVDKYVDRGEKPWESRQGEVSGGDLIGWILSHYKETGTADRLGRDQLIATFVAIHTTTICLTQILFDLAAHPEYIEPLRKEFAAALKEGGYNDGRLHNTNMTKLQKMDSFIRESQRVNPPGLVTMLRRVTSPSGLKLSSGHVIPPATTVGISNHTICASYPDADKFDGFRFSRMREHQGHETKHQFVSTGHDALSFGHGNHACPGRFFAANEIKVVVGHLITNFDLSLKPGESRPQNHHRHAIVSPSREGEILLKARK